MRRNNRRILNSEEEETKKMLYIAGGVVIVAVIAFIVTFIVYSNILNKKEELANLNSKKIIDLVAIEDQNDIEQASSSIGKTVNELQENDVTESPQDTSSKIAVNTSNIENDSKTNTTDTNTTTVEEHKELSFIKPVEGNILKEFAKDKLVYSDTLKEWITHMGIDIKADKTTVVKASEDGVVKSIKNDPRYGITVVLEHDDGFKTIYANLLTAEFVKEKEEVKKGQTLGTIGNTATFEIADDYHLHFELLKDDENVDPNLYIK